MEEQKLIEALHRCRMAGVEGDGCGTCPFEAMEDCSGELMREAEEALRKHEGA